MMKLLLSAILILLLFGCVNQSPLENTTTTPPTFTNSTPSTPTYGKLPANYTVDFGDSVLVDYTLWVNGTVMDTSNATLAIESGIYDPKRSYKPLPFEVSLNKGIITGFVMNVVGSKVNETITFSVPPQAGYGLYDPSKILVLARYYDQQLYEVAPRSYFEALGKNLSNGTLISENPVTIVTDINDENVTLFYALSPGQEFTQNGITKKIVNVTNATASVELMLQKGTIYYIPHPSTGAILPLKVTDINDSFITLDANHPLANQTLYFKVTVLKIKHDNFMSD